MKVDSAFGLWSNMLKEDEFSRWDTACTHTTKLLLSVFQCCPRHWVKEKPRRGLLPKRAPQFSLIPARDIDPCTIHLHSIVAKRKNLCYTYPLSFFLSVLQFISVSLNDDLSQQSQAMLTKPIKGPWRLLIDLSHRSLANSVRLECF